MNENRTGDRRAPLSKPLTLRSGIILPNRLAKAATSEHLADRRGAPTNQLITAYRGLALSGAGLLISGNVMVDGAALEAPRTVVIEDDRHREHVRPWRPREPMPSSSCSCLTQGGRRCAATYCAGVDRTSSPHPRCPSPWVA